MINLIEGDNLIIMDDSHNISNCFKVHKVSGKIVFTEEFNDLNVYVRIIQNDDFKKLLEKYTFIPMSSLDDIKPLTLENIVGTPYYNAVTKPLEELKSKSFNENIDYLPHLKLSVTTADKDTINNEQSIHSYLNGLTEVIQMTQILPPYV